MTDDDPSIRVGDDERRAVDDRLQRAHGEGRLTLAEYEERSGHVWSARTRADLDALTSDLPSSLVPAPPATVGRGTTGAPSWRRRAGTLLLVAAVVGAGGHLLSRDDGAVVFSSRTIPVAAGDDRVEVGVLFGGADVVVPDDARVTVAGGFVFGGVDCEAACAGTGTREITVEASGAFGGVDVLTQSEAAAENADDEDDDD